MKKILFSALSLMIAMLPFSASAKKVHTIGDSTMANYNEESVIKGWGQMLQQFLDGIEVNNRAKSGSSSKSFYQAPEYWASSVQKQISAGDIVLIQFAHNDEKNGGCDGDELISYYKSVGDDTKANATDFRGTTPSGTYKEYLKKYIEDTRKLGAEPILVGPICRKYFTGATIRRNGHHDLGDSFTKLTANGPVDGQKVAADDHTMDYVYQMQQVALEMDVPFVDLTTATKELYESYGEAKCTELLFNAGDGTHVNAMGATLIARLFCQLAQEQGLLTDHIKLSSEMTSSPAIVDFGNAYKGQSMTREFYISGFSMTPAEGTLTITAPEGIDLSTDKINFSQQVTIKYEGGSVIGTLYARAKFDEGAISGEITATNGTDTLVIPYTGMGIVLGGDTEVTAYWRLESNDNCTTDGPITSLGQTLAGMEVQRYANPNANTVWPEESGFTADRKTQRTLIAGGTWPADEIDEVSTRYIEYAVKAADGATINIDRISMYLCGCGGNGMRCKVYYSKEADFANPVLMKFYETMPANNMLYTEAVPVMTLSGDEVLRVRIYPWYNGGASGKTICVSDVTIHGMAEGSGETTGTPGSIYWPFNEGENSSTAAETSVPDFISSTSWSLGENVFIKSVGTVLSTNLNSMNPVETVSGAVDEKTYVCFSVIPKKGVQFVPTKFKFSAAKFGTNGGAVDVVAVRDGVETSIAKNLSPNRNNSADGASNYDLDLSAINPGGRLDIYVRIYSLANNKQLGIGEVTIEGNFYGTPSVVPVYTISAVSSDPEAGTVTTNPAGASFDEGTEISVSASENFGYHFQKWVDADGNEVSTQNPYKFELTADTDLSAVYTKNNVYAVRVALEGGANFNQVQFAPEGNIVNGVHYYEEGEEITLSAINNRILTFTNWDDNSTDASRSVKVTSDLDLTAVFSAEDYIVGWDFYLDEPGSERPADFKADTENAGLLSLHNAEGKTSGWLAGGVNKGGQRGKYCARIWKAMSVGNYFEISFSSEGYSNLLLSAFCGNDFISYAKYDVEYSIDGKNFTKFGEYILPNRGWTGGENRLPAEADNQKRVWIRFMADKEYKSADTGSVFTGSGWENGSENSTDGFSIAEVFVLADADNTADETAPKLLVSIPEDGSNGASANGQVILTFDERILLADDSATLNGEPIAGQVTGKTATFKYSALAYATEYTFTLPAGAITDRNGNPFEGTSITFTTMQRSQPDARLFDAIVAQDGSGDYATVQEAIDAAPSGRAKPWLIFIKEGYYKEHVDIPSGKPFLHFIGESSDKVRICDNRLSGGDNAVHVSIGATVVVNANDCYFEGISFENEYGRDQNNGPQALALNTTGDRIAFNNVKMISYQDTWITPSNSKARNYVTNSWIEGAVDFIYNSGDILIENSTLNIVRKSGGFIVAPSHGADVEWGYVFLNNKITAPGVPSETSVWLGRPWHNSPKTVFINTIAEVTIPATGWYETMGGLPVIWAEYNTIDGNGNPVDLSQRRDTYYYTNPDGTKVYGTAKNILTPEEAAQYTVKNVMSGTDNWQPNVIAEACAAPVVKFTEDNDALVWEAVPYAICYVIRQNGKVVDFTTNTRWATATSRADNKYTVQSVSEYGALSPEAEASGTVGIDSIEADSDAEPVYYNLQGLRIENPAHGSIYIVVRGQNVTKELYR